MDKLRDAGDVDGLLAALAFRDIGVDVEGRRRDRGAKVRLAAVDALADFDGPEVAEALTAALDDPHPAVRAAVVDRLSREEAAGSEPFLRAVATWEAPPYAEAIRNAVEALAASSADQVPEGLVDWLIQDEAVEIQEWHPEALDALISADPRGERAAAGVAEYIVYSIENARREIHLDRAEAILRWLGSGAADAVLAALGRGASQAALARAAGHLRDARAVEGLIRMLNRPDAEVRAAAATALGEIRDTRAVPSLLSATQDAELVVRGAAADALDSMGTAAVIFGLASLGTTDGRQLAASARELPASTEPPKEVPSWAQRVLARITR